MDRLVEAPDLLERQELRPEDVVAVVALLDHGCALSTDTTHQAIERLGATREGVLRQHMPRPDGTQRDTVMYSIIAAEWPQVRARLLGAS